MGFHHVGQAGLELPTSGDPPTLASNVLGLQAWASTPGQDGVSMSSQDGLDLLTLRSACLGLPECWDYRLGPPHPDSFDYISRNVIAGSYGNYVSSFDELPNCFTKELYHFIFPPAVYQGSSSSMFLPALIIWLFGFFDIFFFRQPCIVTQTRV